MTGLVVWAGNVGPQRGGDSTSPSEGRLPLPQPPQRWAGRFRRLEHRRDESYQTVDVAVCGAVLVSVEEWVRLLRCPRCFPVEGP
ncbi:hypothetical protein [Actinoalloteichus sp. GBA129-24]|uniref:hypothetical protein n=1 Tax=Actinoalloteichus sp. GBA129-24 TaxID=1612551 RepID=UPI000950F6C5|nr:hypothetical protein [Actinoalloteichus sp. GBA129-24]